MDGFPPGTTKMSKSAMRLRASSIVVSAETVRQPRLLAAMVGVRAMRVGLKGKEGGVWVVQAKTSRGPEKSRMSAPGKSRKATL